ncbi:MAG: hypothetical protein L6Q98_23780 [Anaerolineae bacterium]|nr:hypothetical protein [Anaerolineae bacterium]NUQ07019.1 hypothetical protein [Anaerolineae bacterium]
MTIQSENAEHELEVAEVSPVDQLTSSGRLRKIELSLDISKAVILSLAALLSAWCGYQSTRWSGKMASDFSRANNQRLESMTIPVPIMRQGK